MEARQVYSPNQILAGSLWGGPVGAVYFLWCNYLALGKVIEAQRTLVLGALFMLALIGILAYLPEGFSPLVIPLVYAASAKWIAVSTQLGKSEIAESADYDFPSNWRVLGIGALTMVLFLITAVVLMLIMESAGWISIDQ